MGKEDGSERSGSGGSSSPELKVEAETQPLDLTQNTITGTQGEEESDHYYVSARQFPSDDKKLSPSEILNLRHLLEKEEAKSLLASESEEDKLRKRNLTEDSFSFLLFSTSWSSTSSAVIVFLLQMTLFVLIAVDNYSTDFDEEDESLVDAAKKTFDIECSFPWQVRVAGFLALLMAVLLQQDVLISVCLWYDGYEDTTSRGTSESVFKDFEGATKMRWAVSSVLRFMEGVLSLAVSLLLIVRSTNVLDLLLNFSAIEIVSNLDDATFALAQKGYFGDDAVRDAWQVTDTEYKAPKSPYRHLRRRVHLGLASIMIICWAIATSRCNKSETRLACLPSRTPLQFKLQNDFPGETAWDLVDAEGSLLAHGGPYGEDQTDVVEQLCLPEENECAAFTVFGERSGAYSVAVNGTEVIVQESAKDDVIGSVLIGNCPKAPSGCEFSCPSPDLVDIDKDVPLSRLESGTGYQQPAPYFPASGVDITLLNFLGYYRRGPGDNRTCDELYMEYGVRYNPTQCALFEWICMRRCIPEIPGNIPVDSEVQIGDDGFSIPKSTLVIVVPLVVFGVFACCVVAFALQRKPTQKQEQGDDNSVEGV